MLSPRRPVSAVLLIALVIAGTARAQDPPAPTPPSTTVDVAALQARSTIDILSVENEQLRERIAELEGVAAYLQRIVLARLQQERQALTKALDEAGYTRDERGLLLPKPPAPAAKDGATP